MRSPAFRITLSLSLTLFLPVSGFQAVSGAEPAAGEATSSPEKPASQEQPSSPENSVTPEQAKFFEAKVRPLLAEHCFKCHDGETQKGGLRLDSRGHLLAGGESGEAIQPGKPDESLLMEAVRWESYEMPPTGKLPDDQIAILEAWIRIGAPWPGSEDGPVARSAGETFSDEDRSWWAFRPVQKPTVPLADVAPIGQGAPVGQGATAEQGGWIRNDIDRFILARLKENNLTPAGEADRTTLIRRLYFDLIGLPPKPEDVAAFVNDPDPQAYEKLVDSLLASPRYGERWGRHWLDLVRYADSDGYRADGYRPDAWRYRDYVIESFNNDKPYDRFVQEQIAGDELFPGDPTAMIATGYLRNGIYEYNARDVHGQWDIIMNEITDTTGDVFLGMGMQCARCHDHKFDPILQKDYFRLRAFFEPMLPREDYVVATPEQKQKYEQEIREWEEKTAAIRAEIDKLEAPYRKKAAEQAIERFQDDIQAMIRKPVEERTCHEHQLAELAYRQVYFEYERLDSKFKGEEKEKLLALRRELAKFDKLRPAPLPTAQVAVDGKPNPPPTVIPKKKIEVDPGFLSILDPAPADITPPEGLPSTGRRTTLATWLTDPENSLSTRVITNRIWQYHFGRGLAANSSDFGKLGDPPTHPELLDWLTVQFLEGGWKIKPLHRLIVTSATYRQSTDHPQFADYMRRDPANTWYWRADTRRLDAEQIRDAIFAVTGQLNLTAGGPGVNPDQPRRSIYTRYMRNSRDPLLDVFDLPLFFNSTSSRDTTTSPIQALLLINSQTMLRYAAALAGQAKAPFDAGDPATAITRVWQLACGRTPTHEELGYAQAFLESQAEAIAERESMTTAVTYPTSKMPYRDGQSVMLDPEKPGDPFAVPNDEQFNVSNFTIEAYFQIRSVYDTGSVRTVASKSDGKTGWAFGVTGKGSRRKPQTLVIQMFGDKADGTRGEVALFSDQHVELNKPYYAAVSVQMHGKTPGKAVFYLKDLSNDDEPLSVVTIAHDLRGGLENRTPLSFGRRFPIGNYFDGLIDDIRLSDATLPLSELLYTNEGVGRATVGYWQFENDPGLLRDTSSNSLHIQPNSAKSGALDPEWGAFVDLCHVLLNSNEFLYVD